MSKETLTYKQSGVDQDRADSILTTFGDFLKTRPRDPSLLSGIGPFASCYSLKSLLGQYTDPILVTCCDGVGTKAKLALDWGRLEGLGQDLVAMNVNDLLCVGAKPLLFLDYYACGKLQGTQLITLLKSIQKGCELAGCSLVGGETAEMPGLYQEQDFDLAGFAAGVAERESILGAHRVKSGDILLALGSSGVHSNGYSLVRKIIEKERLSPDTPTPFGATWDEVLLAPTTIYVPMLKNLLPSVHALAHITGGGLFGNLPRVLPDGMEAHISSANWEWPELFRWLQQKSGITTEEMLTTFNCGVGMIAVCDGDAAKRLPADLAAQGIPSWEIGVVRPGTPDEAAKVVWD
jgi:phosphoribosylformylglycinamidine cyclo-ligase